MNESVIGWIEYCMVWYLIRLNGMKAMFNLTQRVSTLVESNYVVYNIIQSDLSRTQCKEG